MAGETPYPPNTDKDPGFVLVAFRLPGNFFDLERSMPDIAQTSAGLVSPPEQRPHQ
jgi:hypothetical protein